MILLVLTMCYVVAGVYAVTVLSNTLTASWILNAGEPLEPYWGEGAEPPSGDLYSGIWYETEIRLENNGGVTYTVIDRFTISTTVDILPTDCIKIGYWDVVTSAWVDITGVITGWDTTMISGHFGPLPDGFECGPGYIETTLFRIMFESNAPLTSYVFEAWVEESPT